MTDLEQRRLNEMLFCKLIQNLFKKNRNPIKVYDLVEAVANLTEANLVILNNVISIIFNNDNRYVPRRMEEIYLMRKSNIPTRKVYKILHISPNCYYSEKITEMIATPKFSEAQYNEMMKILKFFRDTYEQTEGAKLQ